MLEIIFIPVWFASHDARYQHPDHGEPVQIVQPFFTASGQRVLSTSQAGTASGRRSFFISD